MGAIFDFVLGYLLTWEAVVVIAILGILFEHSEERGFAVFMALVGTAVAYFTFNVPVLYLAYGTVAYMIAGVLWSFYRYKRYVAKRVAEASSKSPSEKDWIIREMHPSAMLPTITAWIIIWPFSFVDNLVGDVIDALETLVKTVFKGVYHRIYESAVGQIRGVK